MSSTPARKIFVNLAVKDLSRTKGFFSALGFTFNPKFTDDKAACMVLSDDGYVMLLSEPFFKGFTKREICDTSRQTEALLALSCDSKADVDALMKKVVEAGGHEAMPPQDHGFMYSNAFYDLDGHHWEIFWMDPKAAEQGPEVHAASEGS